jgi:hypothetical protein
MPIRINLLAEAQAAEELRRRDPAKRALMMAGVLIGAVLIWSGSIQVKLITDNVKMNQLQASLNSRTNEYATILSNQRKLIEVEAKLSALQRLSTNRFLYANLLNALQRTSVEGVTLNRMRIEQGFTVTPAVKAQTIEDRVIPARPGGSVEHVILVMDGRDSSPNPGGDTINQFKECLTRQVYFQHEHVTTNDILLKNLAMPTVDTETGKPFVLFNFECRIPDYTR